MPALCAGICTWYAIRSQDSAVVSSLGFQSCSASFIDDSLCSRHFKYYTFLLSLPIVSPISPPPFWTDAIIRGVRQSVQGHRSGKARIWLQLCLGPNRGASTSPSCCICHGTLPVWSSFSLWNENKHLTCLFQRIPMEAKWNKIFSNILKNLVYTNKNYWRYFFSRFFHFLPPQRTWNVT